MILQTLTVETYGVAYTWIRDIFSCHQSKFLLTNPEQAVGPMRARGGWQVCWCWEMILSLCGNNFSLKGASITSESIRKGFGRTFHTARRSRPGRGVRTDPGGPRERRTLLHWITASATTMSSAAAAAALVLLATLAAASPPPPHFYKGYHSKGPKVVRHVVVPHNKYFGRHPPSPPSSPPSRNLPKVRQITVGNRSLNKNNVTSIIFKAFNK